MKKIILALSMLVSLSVSAAETSKTLVCLMGDAANIDIVVSSNDKGEEKIKVIVTDMSDDGEAIVYQNSQPGQSLKKGSLDIIVSTSDLQDIFGGAYLKAGMLKMTAAKEKGRYDVLFSAQDTVYTANCGEVK